GSFDAIFRGGLTALSQNQLAEARSQLEAASTLKPNDPHVWLALAQTYRKLKESASSEAAVAKAESLAGNDPATLHGLAFLYSESGNYEKAASFEARYANLATNDANAPARAAELYIKAAEPQPAIALATQALAKQDRAELHGLLGQAYALEKNHAKAAEEMRRAIALNPYEETYYFEAGRESLIDGNPNAAIGTVQAGKKVFAKSPQLELILGIADYALENYSGAVDAFLNAIRMDPSIEQPYVFIARTLDHAPSRLTEILAAFKTLAEKTPESYLSNYFYGKALLLDGGEEAAEALLKKSVQLNGAYWESHLELAKALEQKGEMQAAINEFQKAIELNPKDATPHFRLGSLYDRLGKTAEAKAEYAIHKSLIDAEESGPFRPQRLTNDLAPARP
ncbi:MAG TPA: tetratricopeptide repeat protein, partial [Candidatus Binataceae bacterium]|nr:tetratricopeptide repeat protein [Candidatus Binataceae bacterium]